MIKRSTVFIPVVTPKGDLHSNNASNFTEGRFIEVYAEPYRFGEDISDLPAEQVAIRKEQSIYDSKAIDKCWIGFPHRSEKIVLCCTNPEA